MSAQTSAGSGRPGGETAAIREWATANGLEVSTRGRIASTVLQAYENRGNAAATVTPDVTPTAGPAAAPVVDAAIEAQVKPKRQTRKKAAES